MVATIKTVKTLQNDGLVIESAKGWADIFPVAGGWQVNVGGVWENEYDAPHTMMVVSERETALKMVDAYLN